MYSGRYERDLPLEGLRGAAALSVLYAHLTAYQVRPDGGGMLDPGFSPPSLLWALECGTLAVLMFFLLSGHVIGMSVRNPYRSTDVLAYFRRRLIRIMPIYLIAILLGLVIGPDFPLRDAVGHIVFLQHDSPDAWISLLKANPNLWTLSYEAAFYLLFPLLWIFRPPLALALGTCFGLSLLIRLVPTINMFPLVIIGSAAFWIVGLATAWLLSPSSPLDDERGPWPGLILLSIATWKLDPLGALLSRWGYPESGHTGFSFHYFAALPVLISLLLVVSRRKFPNPNLLWTVCWIIPAGYLLWRAFRGTFHNVPAVPLVLLVLAGILWFWRPTLAFWRTLAPVGTISYALYAISYPVQFMIRDLMPDFSGTLFSWSVRAVLVIVISFTGAWCLECRMQPHAKRQFG